MADDAIAPTDTTKSWRTPRCRGTPWGILLAIVVGGALLPFSCCVSVLLSPVPYTTTPVSKEDLVGTYHLSSATRRRMRGSYELSTHSLELKADGTFVLTNMPDWWKTPFGISEGALDSAVGTWRVRASNGAAANQ